MKLTIEHLAPFLPYGLKIIAKQNEIYSSTNVYILQGIVNENLYLSELTYPTDLFLCKPLLRPLSDLYSSMFTELVENNDFKFDRRNGWGTDLTVDGNTSHWEFKGNYRTLSKLFKHHFDVFGLIEQGLAIDINTVKEVER